MFEHIKRRMAPAVNLIRVQVCCVLILTVIAIVVIMLILTERQSVPIRCSNLPPGMARMARGVDITSLDLMSLEISADTGFRNPVLQYTCDKNKVWRSPHGLVFQMPDQVWHVTTAPGGWLSADVRLFKSGRDVRTWINGNTDVEDSIKQFSFCGSYSYKKIQNIIHNTSNFVVDVSAFELATRVILNSQPALSIDRSVQMYLDQMISGTFESNRVAYNKFIAEFGTHFFSTGISGGCIRTSLETDKEYVYSNSENEVKQNAKALFMSIISDHGCNITNITSISDAFNRSTVINTNYYGGDTVLLQSDSIEKWSPTVDSDPWLFSGKLEPIYELIPDATIKESMKKAVNEYVMRSFLEELGRVLDTAIAKLPNNTILNNLQDSLQAMKSIETLTLADVISLGNNIYEKREDAIRSVLEDLDGVLAVAIAKLPSDSIINTLKDRLNAMKSFDTLTEIDVETLGKEINIRRQSVMRSVLKDLGRILGVSIERLPKDSILNTLKDRLDAMKSLDTLAETDVETLGNEIHTRRQAIMRRVLEDLGRVLAVAIAKLPNDSILNTLQIRLNAMKTLDTLAETDVETLGNEIHTRRQALMKSVLEDLGRVLAVAIAKLPNDSILNTLQIRLNAMKTLDTLAETDVETLGNEIHSRRQALMKSVLEDLGRVLAVAIAKLPRDSILNTLQNRLNAMKLLDTLTETDVLALSNDIYARRRAIIRIILHKLSSALASAKTKLQNDITLNTLQNRLNVMIRHDTVTETDVVTLRKKVHAQVVIPIWFTDKTKLCYKWWPDGNRGQCGGGVNRLLCASPKSMTPFYRDDTDKRSGGCRMQWAITSSNFPSWFSQVQICYRWHPDGDRGQCGGGASRLLCSTINSYTSQYRDDTDRRSGGCKMSWRIVVPYTAPAWLKTVTLCYVWYPDGNSGQCAGPSRRLCAVANAWTPYYRDDTDKRPGGCKMSWGLKPGIDIRL